MSADPSLPTTIDEVIEGLDKVVDDCVRDGSRVGYFAALYRTVTASVKEGIAQGFFDDGPRMERFDVAFAGHYFEALHAFRAGRELPRSWEVAFEACGRWRPIILQHVLVGMNAHINLDLGMAAARIAPGDKLPSLRADFDRINELLASGMEQIRRQLNQVSPWIGLLDRLGGRHDDAVIRFSIEVARSEAWGFATELAPLQPADWAAPVKARDRRIAVLGQQVLLPGPLSVALLGIRLRESGDVPHALRVLSEAEPTDFEEIEARVHRTVDP